MSNVDQATQAPRYSQIGLALRYANRESYFGGAVFLLMLAAVFTAGQIPAAIRDARLALRGVRTMAVVKNKFVAAAVAAPAVKAALLAHGGRGNGPKFRLVYEFQAGGQFINGETQVSRRQWERTPPGAQLAVVYLPTDPRVHRLGPPIWRARHSPLSWIGVAALFAAPFCALAGMLNIRRRIAMIYSGLPALALIDEVEIDIGRKGRRNVACLRYTYLTQTADAAQLRTAELRASPLYRPGEINPGDVVLVLYDPNDPGRHEIDRFGARAAELARLWEAVDRSPVGSFATR